MPTLTELRTSSKLRKEQAVARFRKIEARIAKRSRRQTSRLYYILGEGAIAGNLMDQCLKHVSDEKRATAEAIRKELDDITKDTASDHADKPQDHTGT